MVWTDDLRLVSTFTSRWYGLDFKENARKIIETLIRYT